MCLKVHPYSSKAKALFVHNAQNPSGQTTIF